MATTFLSGSDVSLKLQKSDGTAIAGLPDLKITQVSISTQKQITRQGFISEDTPKLIDSARAATSLGFNNLLYFKSDSGSTGHGFANSTRFYIKYGKDSLAYVQGFTLSVNKGVQQMPEIGSNHLETIPLKGTTSYSIRIDRLIPLDTSKNTIDTIYKTFGNTDPIFTKDAAISTFTSGMSDTKKSTYTEFISNANSNLKLVMVTGIGTDGALTTETFTIQNALISAQSISFTAGQPSVEGISIMAESIIESDTSSVVLSNSILAYAAYALGLTPKDSIPLSDVFKSNDKFQVQLVVSSGTITYEDCYIPSYSLSISANAPEIGESFSIVVGNATYTPPTTTTTTTTKQS